MHNSLATRAPIEPVRILVRPDPTGIRVEHSAHLDRYEVQAADGTPVAMLVGVLLHGWADPAVRVEGRTIRWQGVAANIGAFEREVVDGLNGAFVIVTRAPLPERLYLDAGGQIPIVHDRTQRAAACSADGLLDEAEYRERMLPERIERLVGREGHGWIAGTLTAHAGIERLLPNHYLDLGNFTAHRHWPRPDFTHALSLAEGTERVARALGGYVSAVARERDAAITLTAGFDSRLILAAARGVCDRVRFVTMAPDRAGMDQIVAARLAARFGLDHRLVPIVRADAEAAARWDRLVGHAVREANRSTHPTLTTLPGKVMLTGMYGETGRCRLYRQDLETIDREPATARFILSRLTLPLDLELLETVEAWLDPIRSLPRSAVLDLAFNELKFGSWGMAQAPVQKALRMSLAPFGQREVLHAFMAVPPREKGTATLFTAVARQLWADVMTLPINRYGDWRDRMAPLAKVTSPERIRRYLRDRLARS